jgi:lipopolysaccharide/colanic/teichoic acid biosynthesis glycosyltransferase
MALIIVFSWALLPMLALIALGIKLVSWGPVFFRQERIGLGCRPFKCFKFRSMRVNTQTQCHQDHFKELVRSAVPMTKLDKLGDPRLIPLGALLRATGLDELPQVINVLRGEMSLVGPRPCTPYELPHYQPAQRERFEALPGITGLWQVSGKNKLTFEQMIALDIQYKRKQSLWLELLILLKTPAVIAGQCLQVLQGRLFGRNGAAAKAGTANVLPKAG